MQRIVIELKDDDVTTAEIAELAGKVSALMEPTRFEWEVGLPDTKFSMGSASDLGAFRRMVAEGREGT